MLMELYNKAIRYFSVHVNLNSAAHFAVGFGLAILLQHYINGNSFAPSYVGWILVILSVVVHIMAIR